MSSNGAELDSQRSKVKKLFIECERILELANEYRQKEKRANDIYSSERNKLDTLEAGTRPPWDVVLKYLEAQKLPIPIKLWTEEDCFQSACIDATVVGWSPDMVWKPAEVTVSDLRALFGPMFYHGLFWDDTCRAFKGPGKVGVRAVFPGIQWPVVE